MHGLSGRAVDHALQAFGPNTRVGPELFVMVDADPRVRRPNGISRQDCRAYIRNYICHSGFADPPKTTVAFHSEAGLAQESLKSLLAVAVDVTAESTGRFRAIRTLLKYFPGRLEERAPRSAENSSAWTNPRSYWLKQMADIQERGVMKRHVRICCKLDCAVRVGLRSDGAPATVELSVLPEPGSGDTLENGFDTEKERLQRREDQMVTNAGTASQKPVAHHRYHGFRLFALASDFLCQSCQDAFLTLDLAAASDKVVDEWCARMQCECIARRDGDAGRTHLYHEQLRLRKRADLVEIAAQCRRSDADQKEALKTFQQCDWSLFCREKVERYISPKQRHVLESDPARALDVDGTYPSRTFGILMEGGATSLWAPAVEIEENPDKWLRR